VQRAWHIVKACPREDPSLDLITPKTVRSFDGVLNAFPFFPTASAPPGKRQVLEDDHPAVLQINRNL
jgi:hypothetical protein